jgi:predicted CXXCH cytochrome family protein
VGKQRRAATAHRAVASPPAHPGRRRRLAVVAVVAAAVALASGGGLLYAAHFEDNNASCASCHTQPETTYVARSQPGTTPVDLASAHSVKAVTCIQCHSSAGVTGRLAAMTLGAKDMAAYMSGHYRSPATQTVPIADGNCVKCHPDTAKSQDFNRHFHALLPEWQQKDKTAATCVECHQAHPTDGQAQIGFLNEATTTAVCQRCHNFAGVRGD